MQLGQAEALGLLDHHDGGVGHIDPDLDHGRGHQDVEPSLDELGHDRVLLGVGQLAVDQADLWPQDLAQLHRPMLGGDEVAVLGFGDQGADPERLRPSLHRCFQPGDDLGQARHGRGAGGDGGAAGRLLVKARNVEVAVEGQLQGARDRGGRHGQQVHGHALVLQPPAIGDAETVLLVDHR